MTTGGYRCTYKRRNLRMVKCLRLPLPFSHSLHGDAIDLKSPKQAALGRLTLHFGRAAVCGIVSMFHRTSWSLRYGYDAHKMDSSVGAGLRSTGHKGD